MLPEQGGLNRHFYFGKALKELGHEPVVFVGSHPHNTNLQLIESKTPYRVYQEEPFPWVLVKTCTYAGNKLKRVWSMVEYYCNARKAVKNFDAPDVIMGSSAHPLAAVLAIQLGRIYHCKAVVEIRDLWPESIVAYGIAGSQNPAVKTLRWLEKWIYTKADAVVFTMEGAYDYIVEQGWEKEIPHEKVHYVNNGVDLALFHNNRDQYQIEDIHLNDPDLFKIVYTGSIRKVNNLGLLLDVAKKVNDPKVKFLIWGDGDELPALRQRLSDEKIENVVFKGKVDKKYIPYIVSRADLNIAHNTPSPLFRFGISFNKIFDYMAAEKPILSDFPCAYNPAVQCGAGIDVPESTAEKIAATIKTMVNLPQEEYNRFCVQAKQGAQKYDFRYLTKELLEIIQK